MRRCPSCTQVVPGLLGRDRVVRRHRRRSDSSATGALTSTVGRSQLGEPRVVVVRGVLLGVLAADEHDAGDLLLQQELDVVGLGDAAGRLRAQHRRVAVLREPAADDLAERREDRVLQLGQEEADEAGALAAQLGRALVAEHVQRRQHGLAGGLGDPRLLVQHAADGRFADPDLAWQPRRVVSTWRKYYARLAQEFAKLSRNDLPCCAGSARRQPVIRPECGVLVLGAEATAVLKFGDHPLEPLDAVGLNVDIDVEAIGDVGVDPLDDPVGDLLRRAEDRALARLTLWWTSCLTVKLFSFATPPMSPRR